MSGYTKAYRKRFKHPLFKSQKFCRGYAWDWLVSHAVYKDHEIEVKGKIVTINRGQLSYSIRYMAEAWNWDKAAVSRLLTRFKTEAMIETSTETGQIIITICNYEEYQGADILTETASETISETAPRQHRDSTETNKNKDKKEKEKRPNSNSIIQELLLEVASREAVEDFIAHRKAIKKPMTEKAAKMIANKLRDNPQADDVLCLSIENGWPGVYPDSNQLRAAPMSDQRSRLAAIRARNK